MLDVSGSIRRSRFRIIQDYVASVVNQLEVRPERTRVGITKFSDNVDVVFNLKDFQVMTLLKNLNVGSQFYIF